jgi:hypothetical protein
MIIYNTIVFVNLVKLTHEVQDKKRKKKLYSLNNKNLSLHMSYLCIYISRGDDYFFLVTPLNICTRFILYGLTRPNPLTNKK